MLRLNVAVTCLLHELSFECANTPSRHPGVGRDWAFTGSFVASLAPAFAGVTV
jgi:hypothetical protein